MFKRRPILVDGFFEDLFKIVIAMIIVFLFLYLTDFLHFEYLPNLKQLGDLTW